MRGTIFSLARMVFCSALLLSVPYSLAALEWQDQEVPKKAKAGPEVADHLEALAMEILEVGDTEVWEQAAELLTKSAKLRDDADPKKPGTLKLAANLYCWSGEKAKARDLLERSAQVAHAQGDPVFAANAYLGAAYLSASLRMGRHTIAAAQMAEQLAELPVVPEAEAEAIRARLAKLGAPRSLSEIM